MPQTPNLVRRLTLNTENPVYPYGELILGVRGTGMDSGWVTLKNDVMRIASTDSALPAGFIKIRVTEEARQLIDGFEGEFGFLTAPWNSIPPNKWGSQVGLVAAVAEAIGTGEYALQKDWEYERKKDWKHDFTMQLSRYLSDFPRAYASLTETGFFVDSGSFLMRMVYLPDRYWYELMAPNLEPSFVANINKQRSYVRGGGTIAWAI